MFDFLGAHGLNKGGGGGGTTTTQETDTVVIMRSSAPTTVTLGTAIPGSSSAANWTNGDKIGVTNGDIYTVDGSGNTSLTRVMTINTVRRVAVTAGTGTGDGTLEPGLYILSRDGTSTVLMSAPQKSYSTMLVHKVGSVWNLLSAVLGDLNTLTTTAKTSFVAAINELKASAITAVKTINSKTLAGASTNMVVALAEQSILAKFDASVKPAGVTLTNKQLTGTWSGSQGMIRADQGHILGTASTKKYFEVTYNGGGASGNAAVGIVGAASANNIQIGYNGATTHEVGLFQNSGNIYRNGSTSSVGSGAAFNIATNCVCVCVDLELKKIWFRIGGGTWNNNATNNPTTNVGGIDITGTLAVFPAVCSDTNTANFTLNTGATAFTNALPSGFTAWFPGTAVETLTAADVTITTMAANQVLRTTDGITWTNGDDPNVGALSGLVTTVKTSIVNAINEIKNSAVTAVKSINSRDIKGSTNFVIGLSDQNSYGRWDNSRKSANLSLDANRTVATSTAVGQGNVRTENSYILGTAGVKKYFEVTFTGANSANAYVGILGAVGGTNTTIGYSGQATHEVGIAQNSGSVYRNGSTSAVITASAFSGVGSVVCVAVDVELKKIWFRTYNGNWNGNAANNPATGVGGVDITGTSYIHAAISTDVSGAIWTLNTGGTAFTYAVPAGFSEWMVTTTAETLIPQDVQLAALQSGDTLSYNNTTSKWVNVRDRKTVTALTISSGVVNIDWSLGDYFTLALTANITSITFSNLPGAGKGVTLMVRITQDATARTVAWPSSFRWEGTAPVVSTTSGAVDVLALTDFTGIGTKFDTTLSKARV